MLSQNVFDFELSGSNRVTPLNQEQPNNKKQELFQGIGD